MLPTNNVLQNMEIHLFKVCYSWSQIYNYPVGQTPYDLEVFPLRFIVGFFATGLPPEHKCWENHH